MRILISNDDGVRAEGINVLMEVLQKNHQVIMVAPERERSSCGHGLTLGEPVRMKKIKENIYSCSGTPADCVLVGLDVFYRENKPDLIISGINHGANLGQDRFYSGTVAAAREGVFRGIPAIATSLVMNSKDSFFHFKMAAEYIANLVEQNIQACIPLMHLMNINFPNLGAEEIITSELTTPGYQVYSEEVIERVDHRGEVYYWLGGNYLGHRDIEGTDAVAVAHKKIAVTLEDLSGFGTADKLALENLAHKLVR